MKRAILLFLISNFGFFPTSCSLKHNIFKRDSKYEINSRMKPPEPDTNEHQMVQKLDHFNPENDRIWIQRYWINAAYYKEGGPAFLIVNGDWPVRINWTIGYGPHWLTYAKELNAFTFSLEHRYYDPNLPANANLQYLNAGQALADIANFIQFATEEYKLPKDINWIVFGCAYSGTLAAWARLKYPHLIHGAVASSAPLFAKVDFFEYYQVVEEAIRSHDPKCIESISLAAREIIQLMNSTEGRKKASELFPDRAQDITNGENSLLTSDMAGVLSYAVQHEGNIAINISDVCDIMINHNGTKLEAFIELRELHMRFRHDKDEDRVWKWNYQKCSEFGFIQSYNETNAIFGGYYYPLANKIRDVCGKYFGPHFGYKKLYERTRHTNLLYGGLDINVGNTVFIHGSLDPWHKLGIYTRKNDSLYQTIFINGTSQCADGYPTKDEDIPELNNARAEIFEILKVWLQKKST